MKRKFGDKWPVLIVKALILMLIGQLVATLPTTIIFVSKISSTIQENMDVLQQNPEETAQMLKASLAGASTGDSDLSTAIQSFSALFLSIQSSLFTSDAVNTGYRYFIFLGIWIVFLFWYAVRKNNRPLYKTLGTKMPGNNIKCLLIGLGVGFAMNALCVAGALLCGNVHLTFAKFEILPFIGIFLCVLVQSSAEELVCRNYLYHRLRHSYPDKPWVAILLTAALFSGMHLSNPGVGALALIDIFVTGLLFALMVYYCNSFWMVCLVHTAWNFTQNILFGLPNSGMMVPYSVFTLNNGATNGFFYNTDFGVEGTIPAILIQLIACVLVYLWGRKHAVKEFDPWQTADAAIAADTAAVSGEAAQ